MNSGALQDIEWQVLDGFRRAAPRPGRSGDEARDWLVFGLRAILDASCELRANSAGARAQIAHKADGSPVTALEMRVETRLRNELLQFEPGAAFVGEELGGVLPEQGWAMAIDPIDGTWSFLGETASWSTTMAIYENGRVRLGIVANPVTGEIAYAVDDRPTRYLRLSTFGEQDFAMTLGAHETDPERPLVNLQPSRAAAGAHAALMAAWQRRELGIVRALGGSPAWSLVEAARGHFVYANVWSGRPARPYDLAAAALLVRNAGGDVVDLDGASVDVGSVAVPWVAGIDAASRARVAAIVKASSQSA